MADAKTSAMPDPFQRFDQARLTAAWAETSKSKLQYPENVQSSTSKLSVKWHD
jgi:hypothetical protein